MSQYLQSSLLLELPLGSREQSSTIQDVPNTSRVIGPGRTDHADPRRPNGLESLSDVSVNQRCDDNGACVLPRVPTKQWHHHYAAQQDLLRVLEKQTAQRQESRHPNRPYADSCHFGSHDYWVPVDVQT